VNWPLFFLASMATYRLALMGSSEEGPAAIFARLRHKVPPKTNPGRGIRCLYCWSVWIAGLITLLFVYRQDVSPRDAPLYWLAVSAAAIALHQTFTK
jgi:hypothetical protein